MKSDHIIPEVALPDEELAAVTGGTDILDLTERERFDLETELEAAEAHMDVFSKNHPELEVGVEYVKQIIFHLKINNVFGARMAASDLIRLLYVKDFGFIAENNPYKYIFDCLIRS